MNCLFLYVAVSDFLFCNLNLQSLRTASACPPVLYILCHVSHDNHYHVKRVQYTVIGPYLVGPYDEFLKKIKINVTFEPFIRLIKLKLVPTCGIKNFIFFRNSP